MGTVDYMKVVDVVSKTFGASRDVKFEAIHDRRDKIDKFNIEMTLPDGAKITYRMQLYEHDLDFIIDKKYYNSLNFDKWLSLFEFELEQKLLTNMKLNVSNDTMDYRIKLIF